MRLRHIRAIATLVMLAQAGAAIADVTMRPSETRDLGATVYTTAALTASSPAGTEDGVLQSDRGAAVLRYVASFVDSRPPATGDAQWQCLTEALYFEARGESLRGQFAVAEVILNRVDSPVYPGTVCAVVRQGSQGRCQFSFTCDGLRDVMRDPVAKARAGKIARLMLDGAPRGLTQGATHFHTRAVRPGWARRFPQTAEIGAHLFYRQP